MTEVSSVLFFGKFPEAENEAARHVISRLQTLDRYLLSFEGAVALLDISNERLPSLLEKKCLTRWDDPDYPKIDRQYKLNNHLAFMAARDAVMTLYHFGKIIESIRGKSLKECPIVRAKIDSSQLRVASKLFRQWFPDYEFLRHAVAHEGQRDETVQSKKKHAGQLDVTTTASLSIQAIHYTYLGRQLSQAIDQTNIDRLKRVHIVFNSGFLGLLDFVPELFRKRLVGRT